MNAGIHNNSCGARQYPMSGAGGAPSLANQVLLISNSAGTRSAPEDHGGMGFGAIRVPGLMRCGSTIHTASAPAVFGKISRVGNKLQAPYVGMPTSTLSHVPWYTRNVLDEDDTSSRNLCQAPWVVLNTVERYLDGEAPSSIELQNQLARNLPERLRSLRGKYTLIAFSDSL